MTTAVKRVLIYFGSEALQRDWCEAGMDERLTEAGIETFHRVAWIDGAHEGGLIKRWLRRRTLRTLIYCAWARTGSVTAATKLQRRLARRLRLERWICNLLDRFVCDGVRLARAIEHLIPVLERTRQMLTLHRINLVIAATDIYRGQDVELFKAAHSLGIPTLGLIGSWDTLTSKGSYLVPPDDIAVWGRASAEHAIERHGFPKDRVHVIGSLRLDVPRAQELPDVLAPGSRPVVMVAGTSIAYLEHEETLVRHLAAMASNYGSFRVWYRPHPRRMTKRAKMCSETARYWNSLGVYFDPGSVWDEPSGFLSAVLGRVRVVVTAFSTLVIQAALQGTPSILVAYGPSTGGSDGAPGFLLDHAKFEHMAEVASWTGVNTANDEKSLHNEVYHRVKNATPRWVSAELNERANTVALSDGNVVKRLTAVIAGLAKS